MRRERFEFTAPASEASRYELRKEITHNGLPGCVTGYKIDLTAGIVTVSGIYGRWDGEMFNGLTCAELATVSNGDGHQWESASSIRDKNHTVCCRYCGTCRDTGIPITAEERVEGGFELVQAQIRTRAMLLEA